MNAPAAKDEKRLSALNDWMGKRDHEHEPPEVWVDENNIKHRDDKRKKKP